MSSSSPRTRIFGAPVPLEGRMPDMFSLCLDRLELTARNTVGIFRVSGAKEQIDLMKEQFESGERLDFTPEDDIYNVAGVFRLWLQQMPEPLIPFNMYSKFINFGRNLDPSSTKSLKQLRKLVSTLPSLRLRMLVRLCRLLRLIAVNSDENKMTAENLAIVIAPNLLRSDVPSVSVEVLTETQTAAKIVTTLINQYDVVLDGLDDEIQSKSSSKSSNKNSTTTNNENTNKEQQTQFLAPTYNATGVAEQVHEERRRRPSISKNKPPQFDNALQWLVSASASNKLDILADPEKAAQLAEEERRRTEELDRQVRKLAEEEFERRQKEREEEKRRLEEKERKRRHKKKSNDIEDS